MYCNLLYSIFLQYSTKSLLTLCCYGDRVAMQHCFSFFCNQMHTFLLYLLDPYRCEPGWRKHERLCYYFSSSSDKRSWTGAETQCASMGADLGFIGSSEAESFIAGQYIMLITRGKLNWCLVLYRNISFCSALHTTDWVLSTSNSYSIITNSAN